MAVTLRIISEASPTIFPGSEGGMACGGQLGSTLCIIRVVSPTSTTIPGSEGGTPSQSPREVDSWLWRDVGGSL